MSDLRIEQIDPAELTLELAEELAAIKAAAQADIPVPSEDGATFLHAVQYGDGSGPADGLWVAQRDGVPVGFVRVELPKTENTHLANLRGAVAPAEQRRGVGRRLLEEVLAATDRPRIRARAWAGTTGEPALQALGFRADHTHVIRRLDLTREHPDWATLRKEAEVAADDYELRRHIGPTPPADMAAMIALREGINDAPEPGDYEVYTPERISTYEESLMRGGETPYAIRAYHRSTGEPAGLTFVIVNERRPAKADQEDTSVLRAHRGHRLGLLLKLEMIDWLRAERPDVEVADTWNASTNQHMIAINERLGMTPLATSVVHILDR
ncbi:GNAT family N-acetyltransferase [Nocardioides speluncae]|uniref:GNAT family N-acetyltransferase n=1 Tax=Nocardioides speluncae TaxID=2670337 RepID=UPI0013799522|nr:GNAT family N-acetyltransferase [Nocardioides speluncae]